MQETPLSGPSIHDLLPALKTTARHKRWAVVLSRGGHFAAAIFERMNGKVGRTATVAPKMVATKHKTLHRYVVR